MQGTLETEVRIKYRARRTPLILAMLFFGLGGLFMLTVALDAAPEDRVRTWAVTLVCLAFAAVGLFCMIMDGRVERTLVLGPTAVELPRGLWKADTKSLPYTGIYATRIVKAPGQRMLWITHGRKTATVLESHLPRRMRLEDLQETLACRVEIATGRKLD